MTKQENWMPDYKAPHLKHRNSNQYFEADLPYWKLKANNEKLSRELRQLELLVLGLAIAIAIFATIVVVDVLQ